MNRLRMIEVGSWWRANGLRSSAGVVCVLAGTMAASAQGFLTLTPGRTIATTAGTGATGYTGDGSAATSATFTNPSGAVYDASGNLYIADALNHVVRKIAVGTGTITTVAGSGAQGYTGDGGAATSATMDQPMGLAFDSSGNLYIADSHNHAIRKVTGTTISTVAGTGTSGFSGDGGPATSATLYLPQGVAVDASGNLYIADTGNQRIRKVTGTTIVTVAGTGNQAYAGDGGAATAASLDQPAGLAIDSSSNLYIADSHNHTVRMISGTTISTVAGTGTSGFSGDGGSATAATLFLPQSVAVDALGSVYVADTSNHRIREIANGAIGTVAGSGTEDFSGDGGVATSAALDTPRAIIPDASGNLSIADTLNQHVRGVPLTTLAFASTAVGATSSTMTIVLGNSGSSSLTVGAYAIPTGFTVTGGTCSAAPITITAGSGCSVTFAFQPAAVGAATAATSFTGTGLIPQRLLLTGTATQGTKTINFPPPATPVDLNDTATLTATATGGDPVTYTVTTGTATISGSVITYTTSGTVTIQASSPATANYAAATPVSVTVTVRAVPTIVFAVAKKHDFDAPFTVSASSNSTGAFSYSLVSGPATLSGSTVTLTGAAGTVVLQASQAADANYSASTQTASFAVTISSVWLGNGNSSVSAFDLTGAAFSGAGGYTGGGLVNPAGPLGAAFDATGNVWVVNSGSTGISEFNGDGAALSGSPFTGGGLNNPVGVAIDGLSRVWVANGNGSVSELSNSGTALSPAAGIATSSAKASAAIAIDPSGNVWLTTPSANTVTELLGAAAPHAPLATAVQSGKTGTRP